MISNDNMLDDISRVNPYLAPDGGARLHLNDKATLAGQETVGNQNPILYLAYMARAIGDKQVPWDSVALHHAQYVCLGKGRYIRRKGDPLRQSHDNVLAWAWFAALYHNIYLQQIAKDIYNFAKWRFFIYDPHHYYSLDVRCWLQPSHIFILSLAANKRPGLVSCIWFSISCLVADHSSDYYLKSSLRSDIIRCRQSLLSNFKRRIVFFALELMEKRRENIHRWYVDYYREDPFHPAVTVW